MKKILFLIMSAIMIFALAGCGKNEPIKVMSQNLRFPKAEEDGPGNSQLERAPRFKKLVEEYEPDIIGTQESAAWTGKVSELFKKDFGIVGLPKSAEDPFDTSNLLLYRLDRFELLEDGVMWLSDTPEVQDSKLEDSYYVRSANWAILKDKSTKKEILVIVTHLDNGGDHGGVRSQQATILLNYFAKKMKKYPTLVLGDFNMRSTSNAYATMTRALFDSQQTAEKDLSKVNYTFHGFGTEGDMIIDYIFHNKKFNVTEYQILDKQYDGYVSDHYAVMGTYVIE